MLVLWRKAMTLPSDNHIRDMLDPVEPRATYPVYDRVYEAFREQGILDTYRAVHDTELIALDGTWYFSSQSKNVQCQNCSKIEHSNGDVTCYHCFPSWAAMIDFMMRGLDIGPYATQDA